MSAHRRHTHETHAPGGVVHELPLTADELIAALLQLAPERRLSLLDSGTPPRETSSTNARHIIAGFDPFEIIEAFPRTFSFNDSRQHRTQHGGRRSVNVLPSADVLDTLDARLRDFRQPAHTPDESARFSLIVPGACVATIAYDLVRSLEPSRLPVINNNEPDAVLAFYDSLVIHDYARGTTYVTSRADDRRVESICDELLALAADAKHANAHRHANAPRAATRAVSNFTRDAYLAAVRRIQDHIRAGDIYQANLTQRLTCTLAPSDSPADIFQRLRQAHPAPYGAFVKRGSDTIVSISPERFLRVRHDGDARRIEAAPIKGTRPRGANDVEDARLRRELQTSAKDQAENVMIVDLLRNDLGRVCRYGSVEVKELCRLEEHPTLFHLVSTIEGELRDDATAGDIIRAAFPCGSITGAPKIRATEILDEIEPAPRNLSMGAIGYFSFDGTLDLSVAIRTMTIRDATTRFNVGGGITIDSAPEEEHAESLVKARALLSALGATLDVD